MTGALPFSAVVSVPSVLLRGLGLAGFSLFARSRSRVFCRCICWAIFRDRTRPDQTIHGNRCKGRSTLLAASGGIELVFRKVVEQRTIESEDADGPTPFFLFSLQAIDDHLLVGTRRRIDSTGLRGDASQREFISFPGFLVSALVSVVAFGSRCGLRDTTEDKAKLARHPAD